MTLKGILAAGTALVLCASAAQAGGIDRSRLPYAAMFEEGTYVELGFSAVNPNVSGAYVPPASALGASSGNMAESSTSLSLGLKTDINDKLSVGLFVNQPYGADANYTAGFYNGLEAHWSSDQVTALVKYDVGNGVSVYGGAKHVTSQARISIPDRMTRAGMAAAGGSAAALAGAAPTGTLNYSATTEKDSQTALIVGAAYERPEIALRVGLTYEQGFTHSFATSETLPAFAATPLGGSRNSNTDIEMPRSITLDFQSGVAKDTLVFGMIKYSNWSVWEVRPSLYNAAFNSPVTAIDHDVMTYQLGLGRRLNDNLSVFGRITYEKSNGGIASRLAPTDGATSLGLGVTWRKDNLKVTGGVEYARVGDATDASGTRFTGNDAMGVGVQIGYSF